MQTDVYKMNIKQTLDALGSNADIGLMEKEAAARLSKNGKNIIKAAKSKSVSSAIANLFKDVPVLLFVAALIILTLYTDGLISSITVLIILLVRIMVAAFIKRKTENALREVKNASALKATVIRENEPRRIDSRNLVTGDIVFLKKGDCIPADIRIIESDKLKVDQSQITGETAWVSKENIVISADYVPLAERDNLAYMGSTVTNGKGIGVVYATGMNTEAGKNAIIAAGEDTRSPLQDKLSTAGKSLGILFSIICALIFIIGLLYDIFDAGDKRGIPEMIIISLALIAAVVPRGMTTAAKAVIAFGMQKMIKAGVVIKNMRTVLNLGIATIICTDKTGTLTMNKMTVTHAADPENVYEVTGAGYKPYGHVVAEIMITRNIALMSEIAVLCNNASYDRKKARITGDPTEGAMLVYGVKLGHDKKILNAARPRIHEIPFDCERKMMSTYNTDNERVIMYTKGAAEAVISRSSYVYLDGEIVHMSDATRAKLLAQNGSFAAQGLRVLACAYKVYNNEADIDNSEHDLIYVGMLCLADPLREDMQATVKQCRAAGIDVKIITGEHKNTAEAISRALGIISSSDEVVTAGDIETMTDEQLSEAVKTVNVFARITPQLKLRVVTAMKADSNHTVALIGDTAEDVPSLKKADIGIAKGVTGHVITQQTADVIFNNEDSGSIINAVEHGRTAYTNIRKAVTYMLSCSITLLLLFLLITVTGLPLPFTAAQLLLISLLTGMLPVTAIGTEKNEHGVLTKRPRNPEEYILNRRVAGNSITRAVIILAGALAAYLYGYYVVVTPDDTVRHIPAMSMCFCMSAVALLITAYPSKTEGFMWGSKTVAKNKFLNVSVFLSMLVLSAVLFIPGLREQFSIIALTPGQAAVCFALIILTVIGFEATKTGGR